MTLAIDFETHYAPDYSVASLGSWAYCRDPRFQIEIVSAAGSEGFRFVGQIANAPWDEMAAHEHWVSHNASFDEEVFLAGQRLGLIPCPLPQLWDCTADLMGFLQYPRSLKEAATVVLGVTVDKDIRKRMRAGSRNPPTQHEIYAYALKDAELCLQLWEQNWARWPEKERQLSRHTRLMSRRGIGFDRDRARQGLRVLEDRLLRVESAIPWAKRGLPPTSRIAMAQACLEAGIEPPAVTAEKSPIWQEWQARHRLRLPWLSSINAWRKTNRLRAVVEAMLTRSTDNRLHAPLRYYGATVTGRWSGSDGLNLQNLNSGAVVGGVDLRGLVSAPEGRAFVISDLRQIEPRVLAVLSGDRKMLKGLSEGLSVYEAHARSTMGYTGKDLKSKCPELYALAKARVLGLSYGAGPQTFMRVAKAMAGLELSEDEAVDTVEAFRESNRAIVGLWNKLERAYRGSDIGPWTMVTRAGRPLRYFAPGVRDCAVTKGGRRVSYWGAKFCENLIQATARDVLAEMILQIEQAGWPVVLHVHDEIICEVLKERAAEACADISRIMSTPPDWMSELPVECEVRISERYGK
jgi:DNA polymerase I-like protein with 3'-5' exonuclease and polymerase domains